MRRPVSVAFFFSFLNFAFLKQGLIKLSKLALNSLCSPGRHEIYGFLASASRIARICRPVLPGLPLLISLLLFFLGLFCYYFENVVCLHVCICTMYMSDAHGGQKEDCLELESQVVFLDT